MSKVNASPRGLQSLLGNVNQGDNPSILNPNVVATVDLQPFWAVNLQRSQTVSTVVSTVLGGSTIVVPQGELWSPANISGRVITQTTDVLGMSLEIWFEGTSKRVILYHSPIWTGAAANEEFAAGYTFPNEQWYPAGTTFVALFNRFQPASGTRQLQVALNYARLNE